MIISGYQGIGKSTLAKGNDKIIDLESSCFWRTKGTERFRQPDWYIYYCQMAKHLSDQGYIVFVASHKEVREFLSQNYKDDFYMIFPSIDIKDEWIERLRDRYKQTKKEKDYKAYMNALNRYEDNINELIQDAKMKCYKDYSIIMSPRYELDQIVQRFIDAEDN